MGILDESDLNAAPSTMDSLKLFFAETAIYSQ